MQLFGHQAGISLVKFLLQNLTRFCLTFQLRKTMPVQWKTKEVVNGLKIITGPVINALPTALCWVCVLNHAVSIYSCACFVLMTLNSHNFIVFLCINLLSFLCEMWWMVKWVQLWMENGYSYLWQHFWAKLYGVFFHSTAVSCWGVWSVEKRTFGKMLTFSGYIIFENLTCIKI